MDRRDKTRRAGYWVAVIGLLVACTSIAQQYVSRYDFPWALLLGSFIYLHGAFMVLIGSRGTDAKRNMGALRLVRLGFVVVFAVLIWQFFAP